MKGLAFLLMAGILLHSACLGRCWGETAGVPPCHQQEGEDSLVCSEGQAIETKTSTAAEPFAAPIPDSLALAWHSDPSIQLKTVSPPLLRLSVLRI
jgi:hypothetical protein